MTPTAVWFLYNPPSGQKAGTWRLFLGFGRVTGWGDGPATRVQATELPIFPLVLVGGLEDLKKTTLVRLMGLSHGATSPFLPHPHLEGAHECLIHTHHGACIVKLATVVGS